MKGQHTFLHPTHPWPEPHFLVDGIEGVLKDTLPSSFFLHFRHLFTDREQITPWVLVIGIADYAITTGFCMDMGDTTTFSIDLEGQPEECVACIDGHRVWFDALFPSVLFLDNGTILTHIAWFELVNVRLGDQATGYKLVDVVKEMILAPIGVVEFEPTKEHQRPMITGPAHTILSDPERQPIVQVLFCPFVLFQEDVFHLFPVLMRKWHFHLVEIGCVENSTMMAEIDVITTTTGYQKCCAIVEALAVFLVLE